MLPHRDQPRFDNLVLINTDGASARLNGPWPAQPMKFYTIYIYSWALKQQPISYVLLVGPPMFGLQAPPLLTTLVHADQRRSSPRRPHRGSVAAWFMDGSGQQASSRARATSVVGEKRVKAAEPLAGSCVGMIIPEACGLLRVCAWAHGPSKSSSAGRLLPIKKIALWLRAENVQTC